MIYFYINSGAWSNASILGECLIVMWSYCGTKGVAWQMLLVTLVEAWFQIIGLPLRFFCALLGGDVECGAADEEH